LSSFLHKILKIKHIYTVLLLLVFRLVAIPLNGQTDTVPIVVQGKEVVVSAYSAGGLTGMSRGKILLDPESVAGLPSIAGSADLLKLLELTPVVQNPGDAGSGLYFRGGDAGQILILYSGAPLYTPGHLFGFFPLFNVDHIASLEMSTTGVNSRYGGRLGTVIETQAPSSAPAKASVKGNFGIIASQATVALPISKKFGAYLSGRKTYLNMLVQPLVENMINRGADRKIESPDYGFGDANLTLTGNISERDRLQIDVFTSGDKLILSDADILLEGNLRWTNLLASARWEKLLGNARLSQQIFFSKYENSVKTGQYETQINLNSGIADCGYKVRSSFYVGSIPFETGADYTYHFVRPQSFSIKNQNSVIGENHSPNQLAVEHGIYVSSLYSPFAGFQTNVGLRWNMFGTDKVFNSLEPRIALTYRLTATNSLRAAYSRQTQYMLYLSPTSIGLPLDFWAAASQNLSPQSSDDFSVGYYKTLNDNDIEFSADVYYRKMKNLNEYVQTLTAGTAKEFSGEVFTGDGQSYGLEILLKKNSGRLTGWLSYALGRSQRRFPEIDGGRIFPAKFDRRHDLSLVAAYSVNSRINLSAVFAFATGNAYTLPSSWYFIGSMPVKTYSAYNGARMPDYRRTDVAATYRIGRHHTLALSVYNCFATNNPVYIFMNVERDKQSGDFYIKTRHKQLSTITPAVSWMFEY